MSDPDDEFTEFVAHRSPALLRTAYLLCGGDRAAAEDLLQDVLERAYGKRRRIRGGLEPYVRAALANASANRWRTRSRRVREAPLDHAEDQGVHGHESGVLDRDQVARALGDLPARMRAVLVLRYFDDLSEADTAAALGCSTGTVKSQTSRGLERLRTLIREKERA
ncbi:putative RNA polymerase ECF-subfamily sigma factor [Alloactinosynnema sp. L-07]|uniref:SigE family RNA polymerase sigma factor n=1 Tax=Alloactinosynnema sp. L-07 TaxID=1653480 RepID=UPI00065F0105|nr:SigE family RNA polymerase sigma factor [Alloactinosynnema sp. L-07]CRK59131.1 putative RNA polymerase ECF-subfamily sigma factor [Alloactinosynnema sp. L-07]